MIRIEVKKGPMQGKVFTFEDHDIFLFGRDEQHCHASIQEDPFVSRHHFLLEVNPPLSRLRDLGSRNGTFVNGTKHGGRATFAAAEENAKVAGPTVDLTNGDVITAGKTVFQVFVENQKNITAPHDIGRAPYQEDEPAAPSPDIRRTICEMPSPNAASHVGRQTIHELPPSLGRQTIVEMPSPSGPSIGRQTINEPADRRDEIALIAGRATMVEGASSTAGALGSHVGHHETAASPFPQRQLGEFPILQGFEFNQSLGTGSLGEVFLAKRTLDNSPVAVKFLASRINIAKEAQDEFLQGMETSARLRHRNIVQLYGAGKLGNEFYFVTEYCDGGSLARLFRAKKNSLQAKHIAVSLYLLLDGLSYAHDKGLVHRDIKPSNLLATRKKKRWIPKISDFGLNKAFEKAGFSGTPLTETTASSLPYMPRELLTDYKYVNPASDVFSLAASFYRIITGRFPRGDDKGSDSLSLVLQGEVPLLRKRYPGMHAGLAEVLDTALRTECCERYPNAREMQNALRAMMKKEGWV
ncbi:FHA domain-containing protein [Bremerella cremea]|uniref:FHA domain-containing protein n=1 Tax=Bremerella cremea TaxID=1031537 RepID=A0A368KY68_9BACT|nr:FHA domain-containing serine/threonine-protein kinase [Bremerella cremea]RCS54494.1 FHA domain-containing protein [Bremerella cremea]